MATNVKCFDDSMDKPNVEDKCDCPKECNFISYTFTTVSTPFNTNELCPSKSYTDTFLMKPFYENKFPPQFIRKLMKIKNNVSDDAQDYCKKNLQYRAEVIFRMATDTMSVTVMSPRLSFFDKMSAFGRYSVRVSYQCSEINLFQGAPWACSLESAFSV